MLCALALGAAWDDEVTSRTATPDVAVTEIRADDATDRHDDTTSLVDSAETPDDTTVPSAYDALALEDSASADANAPETTTPADATVAETDAASNPIADQVIADGEALLFRVLAGETNLRTQAILTLSTGVTLAPDHARGQLLYGMALLSSLAEDASVLSALQVQPALEKAMALAPDDLRIPGWLGSVKVVSARMLGQDTTEAIAFLIDAAAASPAFNNISLALAFGRFPLDTPWPQMAIDRIISTLDCASSFDVCRNTTQVPHNNEGGLMLVGDVYARVGDAESARYYYELALASPDAASCRRDRRTRTAWDAESSASSVNRTPSGLTARMRRAMKRGENHQNGESR